MTEWNTDLPTQLVVGWTTTEKITDEQIDELLRKVSPHLFSGSLSGGYVSPVIPKYRSIIREWLENL